MIKNILALLFVGVLSFTNTSARPINNPTPISADEVFNNYSHRVYNALNTSELSYSIFEIALKGYLQINKNSDLNNKNILTIIDMSKSSKIERLFIIDLKNEKIAYQSVVAHGKNTGMEFAKKFSNKINSHQSSLGFYKTAETYFGKHGLSLRLDGLESSNNNARKRAIVIHSADYASDVFIKSNGRLGRSYGCPSLPKKQNKQIIEKIKNGSVLFIYHPNQEYLTSSKLVNTSISDLFKVPTPSALN